MRITKELIIKNFAMTIDIASELFYITNRQNNRYYHLVGIGKHRIRQNGNIADIYLVTLPFVQFGVGFIKNGQR